MLSQARALYGIFDPLTAAAAGGMMGLLLWFLARPTRRTAATTARDVGDLRRAGRLLLHRSVHHGRRQQSRWLESTISLMITVLALLTLRFAMAGRCSARTAR